jgi:hypothetical protein
MKSKILNIVLVVFFMVAGYSRAALSFKEKTIKTELSNGEKKYPFWFAFENKDKDPSKIEKIDSSYCTILKLKKKIYKPGEFNSLKGVFYVGNLIGKRDTFILVTTSNMVSGIKKTIELKLTIIVPQILESNPSMLVWRINTPLTEKKIVMKLSKKHSVLLGKPHINSTLFSIRIEKGKNKFEKYLFVKPLSTQKSADSIIKLPVTIDDKTKKDYFFYALVR